MIVALVGGVAALATVAIGAALRLRFVRHRVAAQPSEDWSAVGPVAPLAPSGAPIAAETPAEPPTVAEPPGVAEPEPDAGDTHRAEPAPRAVDAETEADADADAAVDAGADADAVGDGEASGGDAETSDERAESDEVRRLMSEIVDRDEVVLVLDSAGAVLATSAGAEHLGFVASDGHAASLPGLAPVARAGGYEPDDHPFVRALRGHVVDREAVRIDLGSHAGIGVVSARTLSVDDREVVVVRVDVVGRERPSGNGADPD